MKKHIIVIVLAFFSIKSVGQAPISYKPTKYFIDIQLAQQIRKLTFIDTGTLKNSMTFKVTWDEDTVFNQTDPIDCYTKSVIRNDTIYIVGSMIGQLGFGFQLTLFGDSCIVSSFALSDAKTYRYKRTDTKTLSLILLPSVAQKLVLSSKPTFKEGERIAGFVELESQEFYYVLKTTEKKSKIKLRAYFKTSMIKNSD